MGTSWRSLPCLGVLLLSYGVATQAQLRGLKAEEPAQDPFRSSSHAKTVGLVLKHFKGIYDVAPEDPKSCGGCLKRTDAQGSVEDFGSVCFQPHTDASRPRKARSSRNPPRQRCAQKVRERWLGFDDLWEQDLAGVSELISGETVWKRFAYEKPVGKVDEETEHFDENEAICRVRVDDGEVMASAYTLEDGCVPLVLPEQYVGVGFLECINVRSMDHRVREIHVYGPGVPADEVVWDHAEARPQEGADFPLALTGFKSGFYTTSSSSVSHMGPFLSWHTEHVAPTPCAEAEGAGPQWTLFLGDSTTRQAFNMWLFALPCETFNELETQEKLKHPDVLECILRDGRVFTFFWVVEPETEVWLDRLQRLTYGDLADDIPAWSGRLDALPRDTTPGLLYHTLGHHGTVSGHSYADLKALATTVYGELGRVKERLAKQPGALSEPVQTLLLLPPNTALTPVAYSAQMGKRNPIRTMYGNRIITEAAEKAGIFVNDVFSIVLPVNGFGHRDNIHLNAMAAGHALAALCDEGEHHVLRI